MPGVQQEIDVRAAELAPVGAGANRVAAGPGRAVAGNDAARRGTIRAANYTGGER
jgi:hypothetical protein